MDGIAEVAVEGIHIAPVPRHLDGMADGALHAAGSGTVFLGDFRVEAFGHSVDVLRLVHGEQDGIPQELVALDVGGNAEAFFAQLEQWNDEDEYTRCIQALNAICLLYTSDAADE